MNKVTYNEKSEADNVLLKNNELESREKIFILKN